MYKLIVPEFILGYAVGTLIISIIFSLITNESMSEFANRFFLLFSIGILVVSFLSILFK